MGQNGEIQDFDKLTCQSAGIYLVQCECGMGYVGQTARSFQIRIDEHLKKFIDEPYDDQSRYENDFRVHLVEQHQFKDSLTKKELERNLRFLLVNSINEMAGKNGLSKSVNFIAWAMGYLAFIKISMEEFQQKH